MRAPKLQQYQFNIAMQNSCTSLRIALDCTLQLLDVRYSLYCCCCFCYFVAVLLLQLGQFSSDFFFISASLQFCLHFAQTVVHTTLIHKYILTFIQKKQSNKDVQLMQIVQHTKPTYSLANDFKRLFFLAWFVSSAFFCNFFSLRSLFCHSIHCGTVYVFRLKFVSTRNIFSHVFVFRAARFLSISFLFLSLSAPTAMCSNI